MKFLLWGPYILAQLGMAALTDEQIVGKYPQMAGVHAAFFDVVRTANKYGIRFLVTAGCRTPQQEADYIAQGKSKTNHSWHLVKNGCRAIDTVFIDEEGRPKWSARQAVALTHLLNGIGLALGYDMTNGVSWSHNFNVKHVSFLDAYHLQLAEERNSCTLNTLGGH